MQDFLVFLSYLFELFFFIENLFITIPTPWTIFVELLLAIFFPIAFPPTVKAETTALSTNCKLKFIPNCSVIFTAINALIAPLNTPQISPITSAQIFDTLGAFLINFIESLEPSTFLVALAWNSFSLATVTATPIISNIIPIKITAIKINIAGIKLKFETPFVDTYENKCHYKHFNKPFNIFIFIFFVCFHFLYLFLLLNISSFYF